MEPQPPALTLYLDPARAPLDALAEAALSGGDGWLAGLGIPLAVQLTGLDEVEAAGRPWLRATLALREADAPPGDAPDPAPLPEDVQPGDLAVIALAIPPAWLEAAVDRALRGQRFPLRERLDVGVARVRLKGEVKLDSVSLPDPDRPLRVALRLSVPKANLKLETILGETRLRLQVGRTEAIADLSVHLDPSSGAVEVDLERLHDIRLPLEAGRGLDRAGHRSLTELVRAAAAGLAGDLARAIRRARVRVATLPAALPGLDGPTRARLSRRGLRARGGLAALDVLVESA